MWYHVKVLRIMYNLFAGADTPISTRLRANRQARFVGGAHPIWGRGFVLGGRVWYPVIVLHIRYNWFAGNEAISLRLRTNRDANFAWGRPPIFGRG